ncbi:hypothetical protein DL765_002886 [Monosporascus sp. GIB2]|nr:hypothetical protein DL765_002886 [Monosporascus sp. GIB2]
MTHTPRSAFGPSKLSGGDPECRLEHTVRKAQQEAGYALIEHSQGVDSEALHKVEKNTEHILAALNISDGNSFGRAKIPTGRFTAPPRNFSFVGRDKKIQEIHSCLQPSKNAGDVSKQIFVVICGLGGIGKSQLTLEYAHRFKESYGLCFWICCDSAVKAAEGFSEIARVLELDDLGAVQNVGNVKDWLSSTGIPATPIPCHAGYCKGPTNRFPDEDWLLIFDNAESPSEIADYWPRSSHGAILLTTQDASWLSQEYITHGLRLDSLSEEDGVSLIESLFSRKHRDISGDDAVNIFKETGGLPLAIRQIASYILAEDITPTQFFDHYQKRRGSKTLDAWEESITPWYSHTLATFLDVAFSKLTPRAILILGIISFLDVDKIQEKVLRDDVSSDEDREPMFSNTIISRVDQPMAAQVYSFHASILSDSGNSEKGLEYFEKALEILRRHLTSIRDMADETDHVLLANAWNNLGAVHCAQGNYARAEMYNEMALRHKQRLAAQGLPMSHLLCLSYQNMANTYAGQGRYDDAAEYFEKAIDVASIQESASRRALTSHNFGLMRLEQNRVLEARKLLEIAYQLRSENIGDHPDTAASLHMLACCYSQMGNADNLVIARYLLQESLRILQSRSSNIDESRIARALFKLSLVQTALLDPMADATTDRARCFYTKLTGRPGLPEDEEEFDRLVPYI